MKLLLRCTLRGVLFAMPTMVLAQHDGISIDSAWSRTAMPGRTGVVYLTITDSGAADRLTAVASPIAAKAELHESFTEQGVAKMRAVDALPVTPGKPVTLAPGGYHIMLMGLRQELKPGDSFPVTLSFEHAGQVAATVTVRQGGGGMSMGHDPMPGMATPGGKTP
jgi:periplasmic copper chaperone A